MNRRIDILDGWRALSILLVLAGHLLPIGPKAWGLNGATAATGMALFFILSGFLITRLLLTDPSISNFLFRRLFRILPLAIVAIIFLSIWRRADAVTLTSNLMFVANLPPDHLLKGGEHLWSLCVEMQFYIGIALLVLVFGQRSLYALPIFAIGFTLLRVYDGATISIVTWHRVDEILAGGIVALLYSNERVSATLSKLPSVMPLLILPIVFASAHPAMGPLNYLRPYLAAAAIGISIFAAPELMRTLFRSKISVYIAQTSYAVYIVHGIAISSWLGSGGTLVKYAKRPLLLLITFGIAHLSTFYYEARMIELGKRVSKRWTGLWKRQAHV